MRRELHSPLYALIAEFDASDSQLERDLLQFVEQLCAKGLAAIV